MSASYANTLTNSGSLRICLLRINGPLSDSQKRA